MASTLTHRFVLLLSVLLASLAISAAARPCKTIIFISSSFPADGNPNFPIQNPKFLTFSITQVRELNPNPSLSYKDHRFFHDRVSQKPSRLPVDFDGSVGNSIRDRSLDIMSIVGALLFGVGSGALTAATMYLIWSLFSPKRFDYGGDSDEDDDCACGYDDVSPKKMGYVAVPADAVAVAPAPAKQVE